MANTVSNEENENDSDSLGLFELLESRTFDYLSLFQKKKKKRKVKFAVSSMDWEKRKPVEQPVNEVNTGGNAFPALKRLLSVTPSSPFFSFYSPPCTPTFFVNVGHLPGHNYNWRNVGYLLINRRLSLIFCRSRTESGIKNVGWYGLIWRMERVRRRKAKERGFEIGERRGRGWERIRGEIKS